MPESPTVAPAPQLHRYEIYVGDKLAGFTQYSDHGDVRVFTHTAIDDAFQGQGLASKVVAGALAHVRESGMRLAATCPVVLRYLEKHHEFDDILATD